MGLGLGNSMPPAEVSATIKTGWLKHFKVALGSAGGAAAVVLTFELLGKQPDQGFKLLAQWGPWPVIALVGLVIGGGFMSKINETIATSFNAMVASAQQQARSGAKTADALTRLAEHGSKQSEEVRRLTIYAVREFPAMYDRFSQLDSAIEKLTEGVSALHWAVNVKGARGGEETNERGT